MDGRREDTRFIHIPPVQRWTKNMPGKSECMHGVMRESNTHLLPSYRVLLTIRQALVHSRALKAVNCN